MLPSNPICPVCNYATSAVYCDLPTPEQLANGVKPLDSLPAAWWNNMWSMVNCSVNQARGAVGSFITEINNVLAGAGICPNCVCTDQLYQAIEKIRQTIGSATVAGAVKSSSTPGMVSIDENGFMTANCVGNATQLATTAHTLVGAVNELKTTYDACTSGLTTAVNSKAPTYHATAEATYGVGTATAYGHLRISDTYTSNLGDAGMAASQSALYSVYNYATQIASSAIGLGNTAGCALGTASAGSATTAARSDHVHPMPSCVMDKYSGSYIGIGYGGPGLTAAQLTHFAAYSTNYENGCTVIKDVSADTIKQVLGLGSAAYASTSDFRSCTWVPDSVEYSTRACGLPELAGLGCNPHQTWALHNIWNYCGDNRNYLISYPSDNPSGNALQHARVDYANCATSAGYATSAGSATSAGYATRAGSATRAGTADDANALGGLGWTGHLTDLVEHTNYWAYIEKSKFTYEGGYIVYSNGLCIQWGVEKSNVEAISGGGEHTFHVKMYVQYVSTVAYRAIYSISSDASSAGDEYQENNSHRTTISFEVYLYNRNNSAWLMHPQLEWITIGFIK